MTTEINNNTKTFLINRSDLEGRIEPEFYKPFNTNLYNRLVATKHFRLKDIVSFSNETWNQKDFFSVTFPYIEISEIELETGVIKNIKNVKLEEAPSRAKMIVRENDIIVSTTRPTRGAIALFDKDDIAIASTGFCVIRKVNESIILKEALFKVLRMPFVLQQMGQRSSGGNYPAITQEELGKIVIPFIEKNQQQEIISISKTAYTQKQQKEAQAKALLQGIDTYILETLGITIPQKLNGIEHRIFTANFSDVVGLRFDPIFFNSTQKSHSDIYENKTLKSICKILKGQSITKEKITEGDYPVIAGGQSSPYNHGSYNYEGNVITISASGAYSGYVWYHNYPIFASDCIVLQSKNEEEQNTQFIYYVLKALQQEIYKLQQGAGQPHVYARDIEKFTIPIPAMPKQIEMLKHIDDLHHQINTLKADAIAVLENAKAEVEKIIIG